MLILKTNYLLLLPTTSRPRRRVMDLIFAANLTIVIIYGGIAIFYSKQIWLRRKEPPLSTWLIFLCGTGLSLATFARATTKDFGTGMLNATDVALCIIISLTIWIRYREIPSFKPWEKWYLAVTGIIVLFWAMTGNAKISNFLIQLVITLGYAPMIQNLINEKKNVESFPVWGGALAAGLIALYPVSMNGDIFSLIYAGRTILCVFVTLCFMVYYEYRSRQALGKN